MFRRLLPLLGAALIALILVPLALPGTALAHERRTIANGKYEVVVGWDVEPAYANQKNAAGIRIMQAGTGEPVTGAQDTLKVIIRQGATSKEFALRATSSQPGYYTAPIVPTREGDYQWTFTGTINGDPVNEVFDTADKKFNGVEPLSAIQVPAVTGTEEAQLAAQLSAVQAEAQSARTLAYAGIGLGVLGLIVAAAAWVTRPKTAAPAPARHAGDRV